MIKWLHHILNPHCPDCILERQEKKICQSCETLTMQLALSNNEKERLLNKLLEKPSEPVHTEAPEITHKLNVPWKVRQQMLEAEDRKKAQLMRDAPKSQVIMKTETIENLEKELGVVGN